MAAANKAELVLVENDGGACPSSSGSRSVLGICRRSVTPSQFCSRICHADPNVHLPLQIERTGNTPAVAASNASCGPRLPEPQGPFLTPARERYMGLRHY